MSLDPLQGWCVVSELVKAVSHAAELDLAFAASVASAAALMPDRRTHVAVAQEDCDLLHQVVGLIGKESAFAVLAASDVFVAVVD